MGMAVLLAFAALPMLSAVADPGTDEDALYASRYLQFIDQVRANTTAPLIEDHDAVEHDVTGVQTTTAGYIQIPVTLLEKA